MRSRGHALAHEHRRARRRLEHVVHALDLQRRALLVRPRPDRLRDLLRLRPRHELRRVRAALWWPQVRLAANEDDGYLGAADRAHFFYPLREGAGRSAEVETEEATRETRTLTETLSSESGVSMAKAIRMTCDFE